MSFGVGTFAADRGEPFAGVVTEDRVVDLRPQLGDSVTVLSLLEHWDHSLPALTELARDPSVGTPVDALRVLAPIHPPGAFLCAAVNYRKHIIEMRTANAIADGRDGGEAQAEAASEMDERAAHGVPFMFVGWPGAVVGARDEVMIPADSGERHDWELELAVVIGRHARCVSRDEALDHVAGYTTINDISTRDRMHRADLRLTDFLATKMRPTFKPIGPWITPARFVPEPQRLGVKLRVNGETMQDDSTDDMIFDVARLIEYASGMTDLRPGDMIATGSPSGNAAHHGGRFLKPGDVIDAEIEGLGAHRNVCVAATTSPKGPDVAPAFRLRSR